MFIILKAKNAMVDTSSEGELPQRSCHRDGVRSSVIWGRLGVELLLLHIQSSLLRWPPPGWGIHVLPGGGLGCPGSASVFPQISWRRHLARWGSGFFCLGCCPTVHTEGAFEWPESPGISGSPGTLLQPLTLIKSGLWQRHNTVVCVSVWLF